MSVLINPTVCDFVSNKYISKSLYKLNKCNIAEDKYLDLLDQSFSHFNLLNINYNKIENDLSDILPKYFIEPRLYDLITPPGYGGYLDIFPGEYPTALIYSTDTQICCNLPIFKDLYDKLCFEKEDLYALKTFYVEDTEFCWVGFNVLDNCVFIHHNQINGIVKGRLTGTQERSLYKYILGIALEQLKSLGKDILIPTATTYSLFSNKSSGGSLAVPTRPYEKQITTVREYDIINTDECVKHYPSLVKSCAFFNHLQPGEILLRRYRHDNP